MMCIVRRLSVFMVICLLVGCFCTDVHAADRKKALPTSAGIQALRNEFESDVAPKAGGYALDYCYYSPVGNNDKTKYPLVIFLHGIGHADYAGTEGSDSGNTDVNIFTIALSLVRNFFLKIVNIFQRLFGL